MDSTNPVATPLPENKTGRHSRMALAAALLSIFGIAAVVLGHLSRRRIGRVAHPFDRGAG